MVQNRYGAVFETIFWLAQQARKRADLAAEKPRPQLSGEEIDVRQASIPNSYLEEIRRFPILSAEEERDLAQRWRDDRDAEAARLLAGAHLRYVVKVARGFSGYGLPIGDLIAEGNLGLMQAMDRFDPERGNRFVTYATWWIRAAIQDYVLRSYMPVRAVTTADRKKLFFNLRRIKARDIALYEGRMSPEQVNAIATELGVSREDVVDMDQYLEAGEHSLNAKLNAESGEEWQEFLADESPDQENLVAEADQLNKRRALMQKAMDHLSDRERFILRERRLAEEPPTLETLAQRFGVSRERIRQIEVRAFEKVRNAMTAAEHESVAALN